ncbi:Sua5 YciO YrdC YwlC family protein [Aliarcobacter butzleri]|uniref:Sua5 YciO YrdC YwlC family protein n=1 Tax=Aliarcobacter butzleri TaxID=28197 RepID=UPI0021B385D8|nr:Sua5 YciO YrdC YwlC family protein [Aliarcobacter butzleri]MCT7596377.1 Sua5 YciO YrdC YwlC family protein [Aliarcobacter butzleri]
MDSALVYLVQTDTTVGFSSSNDEKLSAIKKRPNSKKILNTVDSFITLNRNARVPKNFRKLVRNSKKTTFIYPNLNSFRVVSKDSKFYDFISKFFVLYSTSANETTKNFEINYASKNADVIVENADGFYETTASSIIKLSKKRFKKLR